MTENKVDLSEPGNCATNDTAELERFLFAYQPSGVPPEAWALVREPAVSLVMRAGALTRLRVEKDIQLLGAVVGHLSKRGRPITLEEALSDTTVLSFDSALTVSPKTRENKRGILRRLQAVHGGLPWRTERRSDGARVENLVPYAAAETMQRILTAAEASKAGDPDAAAFAAAVAAARAVRRPAAAAAVAPAVDDVIWRRARTYAQAHGWHLTKPILRAAVTHELLGRSAPVAILIVDHVLSRRDLDLALTQATELPDSPSTHHRGLLRGPRAAENGLFPPAMPPR